jgi:hypothetical protein
LAYVVASGLGLGWILSLPLPAYVPLGWVHYHSEPRCLHL